MSNRQLLFILRFRNLAGAGLKKFTGQIGKASLAIKTMSRNMVIAGQRMRQVGTSLTFALTGPLVAGFALAVKASADFEQALAGVEKTVGGTPEQIAALGDEFTELSNRIPVSAKELAGVGQAAGQLGVPIDRIIEFTEVAAQLGVSTNLSAQEASIALAKLSAAAGVPRGEFSNLGSAVVALGNNFEVFEGELIDIATRLSATGRTLGLNAQQFLGIGTAVRRLGIQVQRGGTAISRTFATMSKAIIGGGEELTTFAEVTGLTREEFRKLGQTNPGEAFVQFIEGISTVRAEGKNAIALLDDLSFSGDRVGSTLLALSGQTKKLRESMELSSDEYVKNTELAREADIFFSTLISRLKIMGNQFVNAAREIGDEFRPEVDKAIEGVKKIAVFIRRVAKAIKELSPRQRQMLVNFILIAAALGPVIAVLGTFTFLLGSLIGAVVAVSGFLFAMAGLLKTIFVAAVTAAWKAVVFLSKAILNLALRALGLLLAPLGSVIAVFVLFALWMQNLRGESVNLGKALKDMVNDAVSGFIIFKDFIVFTFQIAEKVLANFGARLSEIGGSIAEFGRNILAGDLDAIISNVFAPKETVDVFAPVEEAWEEFLVRARKTASDNVDFVGPLIESVKEVGTDVFGGISDGVTGLIDKIITGFKDKFSDYFTFEFPQVAAVGGGAAVDAITKQFEGEGIDIKPSFWDNLVDAARIAFGDIKEALEEAGVFDSILDDGIDALDEFTRTGKLNFREFARDAISQIQKVILKMLILAAINKGLKVLGNASNPFSFGGSLGGGGATDAAGINAEFEAISLALGGVVSAMGGIKRFQSGGIVTGPPGTDNVLAAVSPGETILTRAETRNRNREGSGETTINVTLNVNGVTDPASFRRNRGAMEAELAAMLGRASTRNN